MNYSELPRHNGNFLAAAWECSPKPIWHTCCTIADRACIVTGHAYRVTATAARWYYRAFLGAEAIERYEIIGELLWAIGFWVYAHVKIWVDAQVEANLPNAEAEEPAEVLTGVRTALSFKDWVLLVVFKVRATTLRFLHPQQTAASIPDRPQLQPCL